MGFEPVVRRWVIITSRGKAPFTKRPTREDNESLVHLVEDALACNPGAVVTVAKLTNSLDLWLESGAEFLAIDRASTLDH